MNLLSLPLTLFWLAAQFGSIGLYAHSYDPFFEIERGDHLYYEQAYTVVAILEYQALEPDSVYSDFYGYGETLTAEEMFMKTYGIADRVVLQTCIEKDGDPNWGRLFVIAVPYEGLNRELAKGLLEK